MLALPYAEMGKEKFDTCNMVQHQLSRTPLKGYGEEHVQARRMVGWWGWGRARRQGKGREVGKCVSKEQIFTVRTFYTT